MDRGGGVMATRSSFTEEEISINEGLGYPKAYAKLCRNPHLFNPYYCGPPSTFIPYSLQKQQALRAKELDHMFPIVDPDIKPSANLRNYASILWKQLDHLGNAGFDPAKFRVDPYGNVLYIHADSGSPLSWDICHWFPCSRGGMTVPGNLRVLQWQVCRKMQNKLEFLVPWWDLQLGVSVNQFLSVFASKNSDFRSRAFSFLFIDGETEELNASQSVDSHRFPQHFIEAKRQAGLAPAAIVSLHSDFDTSTLKSLDLNRPLRSNSPAAAARKFSVEDNEAICMAVQQYGMNASKDEKLDMGNNQYAVIAIERNSLKHKKETEKKQEEKYILEDALIELKQRNEEEQLAIQNLESVLLKYRRKAEKFRKLAEEQSSYKVVLEKMIRDAMHQSVIYKEQIRLNQAANRTLMARLEAQRAISDSAERDFNRQLKKRDEIENQIGPYWEEQARKRSRMDDTVFQETRNKTIHFIPRPRARKTPNEDLDPLFAKSGTSVGQEQEEEEYMHPRNNVDVDRPEENENQSLIVLDNETQLDDGIQNFSTKYSYSQISHQSKTASPIPQSLLEADNEEHARKIGKGNLDKWLQMLLENTCNNQCPDSPPQNTDELENMGKIVQKLNLRNLQKEIQIPKLETSKEVGTSQNDALAGGELLPKATSEFKHTKQQAEGTDGEGCSKMFEESNISKVYSACSGVRGGEISEVGKEKGEINGKGRRLVMSENGGASRLIPSSPSVISRMRRGADSMRKKPLVVSDDENVMSNRFFKTPIAQAIKKALKK
eukprot:TRINITY_DN8065_c0_g3_i2.p1 TRINITY_DN8065_c0_g3~~TRINITY_DN8065_c0_g3_i2.p1  ORF type:complete len:775 (-),score=197.75 TRINITY_DN8065_c0_g3_i2:269-2593(-)